MNETRASRPAPDGPTVGRAVQRIVAEIKDGLRHGHFTFDLRCEVIGQQRRRLTLSAGKSYQFVIPKEECEVTRNSIDSYNGSDRDDT
jgi:hypothetical protein